MQCYKYGVAAPMWFGTGPSFQFALTAILGVDGKAKGSLAYTLLEIV